MGERTLVRAFLKTDDFLLMTDDQLAGLGLGLTRPRGRILVYNRKRNGEFRLGGRRFRLRVVKAYPKAPSREYMLVDLLNNAKKLPGGSQGLVDALGPRLDEFDRGRLHACLDRYGKPEAKKTLRGLLDRQPQDPAPAAGSSVSERMPLRIVSKEDARTDLGFWLRKTPAQRLAAVEFLREQYYALSGCKSLPRLAHCIRMGGPPA